MKRAGHGNQSASTQANRVRLVSRRSLLSGGLAAGAALGLPLLSSLPRANAQANGVYPRRFVFLYTPNGTVQDAFWPISSSGTFEQNLNELMFGEITEPLAPFRERLLFLKGVALQTASLDLGPGGPHQRGIGTLLTGRGLQSGVFRDGCGSQAGWADGISVDQEIARHYSQITLLPSLELGVRATEADVQSRISYLGPGNPMPPANSPLVAYERLFAGVVLSDESSRDKRQRVVDTLKTQYELIAPRLSGVDRFKVDQHLELMRGLERRLSSSVDVGMCMVPSVPPNVAEDDENTMQQISQLHVQLLAAAFACDLTRVATLQFSTAFNTIRFPWLDSNSAGHALSHAGPSDMSARAQLVARHRWYAQQMADLLAALDAIPEGDGTVLDNTVVIWGNELGLGNLHSHTDIPFVMAGSAGGYYRTGRLLQYDQVAHNGLWVSVLNAMGIAAMQFGHPDFSSGALSGLT